ncbi:hypothetical protein MB46_18055 [Arthrobacter alpinus]|uniref:hypothetical protein n=1 Tax=Arthrobacter alpinus TaxID=656366 RepID=UPI0005CAC8BE|nr:hypothetical protein [Arthrobacter alpinus]ALV47107.1 hypothetical protein MB46_18055 [Arthrobacter alpinus]
MDLVFRVRPTVSTVAALLGKDSAELIDESFAVLSVLAQPLAGRPGLGAERLDALMTAAQAKIYWLQTTVPNGPAPRLYRRKVFLILGSGPDVPDGLPRSATERPTEGPAYRRQVFAIIEAGNH